MRVDRVWALWLAAAVVACGDDAAPVDATDGTTGDAAESDTSSTSTGDVDPTVDREDETTTTGDAPTTIPGDGPFGAGTRLHPVVESAGDEHRLMHWYDTELGIECELLRDAAGDVRCLPFMPPHLTAGFASADCGSDAVLRVGACGTAPALVRTIVPGSAACLEGLRYLTYRTGAPRSSLESIYEFAPWWGECSETTGAPGLDYELDRVDDEMFARAHWVVEAGANGIGVRAVVGEDGSWQRIDLVDDALDSACDPGAWVDEDAEVRWGCVPRTPDRIAYGLTDEICIGDELVGMPQDGTCMPATVAHRPDWTWMQLAALHDDVAYQYDADEYCIPFEPEANLAFHHPGPTFELAPIDIDWAPAQSTTDGRLVPYGIAVGDETIVITTIDRGYGTSDGWWYDTLLGFPCIPILTEDGRRVCVPGLEGGPADDDVLWGDPTCSEIELRLVFSDPPPMIGFTRHGGCAPQLEGLRNVVGTYDGPVYAIDPAAKSCIAEEVPDYGAIVQLGNVPDIEVLATLDVFTLSP